MTEDEQTVEFTVKELLHNLNEKVSGLAERVVALEGVVKTNLAVMGTTKQFEDQAKNMRWMIVGLVLNAFGILATLGITIFELLKK
jgi:hypothetical protein